MAGSALSPWLAGLKCVCPHCGQGSLYKGILAFNDRCKHCEVPFDITGSGDGPAFFVMFTIAILITPPVLATQIILDPPVWVQTLIWGPVILAGSIGLLRLFKATLFALEMRHRPPSIKSTPNY